MIKTSVENDFRQLNKIYCRKLSNTILYYIELAVENCLKMAFSVEIETEEIFDRIPIESRFPHINYYRSRIEYRMGIE